MEWKVVASLPIVASKSTHLYEYELVSFHAVLVCYQFFQEFEDGY